MVKVMKNGGEKKLLNLKMIFWKPKSIWYCNCENYKKNKIKINHLVSYCNLTPPPKKNFSGWNWHDFFVNFLSFLMISFLRSLFTLLKKIKKSPNDFSVKLKQQTIFLRIFSSLSWAKFVKKEKKFELSFSILAKVFLQDALSKYQPWRKICR